MSTPTEEKVAAFHDLIRAIFFANARLIRFGDDLLRDLNLTGARWQVFGAVRETPRTVAQIARKYELSRQGVRWIVQSLLQDDLVKYIDNPDHRRSKLLVFTDHGQAIYREVERRRDASSRDTVEELSFEEMKTAEQCLRRLERYLLALQRTSEPKPKRND